MQLLTVVLGRPGTIGFATGLAHPRAPNLWGKQGWYTGQGIIAWDLTHGNYGSTTWTDSFVDSLLGGSYYGCTTRTRTTTSPARPYRETSRWMASALAVWQWSLPGTVRGWPALYLSRF